MKDALMEGLGSSEEMHTNQVMKSWLVSEELVDKPVSLNQALKYMNEPNVHGVEQQCRQRKKHELFLTHKLGPCVHGNRNSGL
jgi:hypothetical protein